SRLIATGEPNKVIAHQSRHQFSHRRIAPRSPHRKAAGAEPVGPNPHVEIGANLADFLAGRERKSGWLPPAKPRYPLVVRTRPEPSPTPLMRLHRGRTYRAPEALWGRFFRRPFALHDRDHRQLLVTCVSPAVGRHHQSTATRRPPR